MTNQSNGTSLVVQGRIVWTTGDLFQGRTKTDFNSKQPILNADGTPKKEYGLGLAVSKIDVNGQPNQQLNQLMTSLNNEALSLFPGGQVPPGFAMKFKDGDGVDHTGKPYANRQGYAGHIVLACTTQLPITFYRWENGNNVVVNTGIKCGDYVNVQVNIKAHPAVGQGKAGLYVNPNSVQLVQEGPEIINAPSGDDIFGQAAPNYSAGQALPNTAPQMPGVPPQNVAPAPQAPIPGQQNVAHNPAAPAPHYGVLPQNMQPQGQVGNGQHVPPATSAPMPSTVSNMGNTSAPTAYPSNGMPAPTGNVPPQNSMSPTTYPSNNMSGAPLPMTPHQG